MLAGMRYKTVPLLGLVLLVMVTAACFKSPAESAFERGRGYDEPPRDITKAIEEYDEAIKHDPTYAGAYFSRARAYLILGKCDEALRDFQKASQFGHDRAYAGPICVAD